MAAPEILSQGKTFKLNVGELIYLDVDIEHYYWLNGEFVPAVTKIIDGAGPVGFGLREFWKNNTAEESDVIASLARDFGSKIHDGAERLLKGLELDLVGDYPTPREKKALTAFARWFRIVRPVEFEAEQTVASAKYKYAGTLDFVGKIQRKHAEMALNPTTYIEEQDDGTFRIKPTAAKKLAELERPDDYETWLVDFKTNKSGIYFGNEVQAVAYKQAYEESTGLTVDRVATLQLATTHKHGFGFKEVKRPIEDFMNVYQTYLAMHGGKLEEPAELKVYPQRLKIIEEVAS